MGKSVDIELQVRRDAMAGMLRKFVRESEKLGASAEEATAALLDMAATVYAVRLAGAESKHQKRRAKAAFLRVTTSALDALPTAQMDVTIEAKLHQKGL